METMSEDMMAKVRIVASMLGVDITPEREAELRGLTTMADANKKLVGWKTEAPKLAEVTLYPEEIKTLESAAMLANPRVKTLKDGLVSFETRINQLNAEVDRYIADSIKYRVELKDLESKPQIDIVGKVKEALETGLFTISSVGSDKITFKTRDIICSFIDKDIGMDLRVPMGKYRIQMYYRDLSLRVLTEDNNLNVSGYYHPHVDTYGAPCYGNIKNAISAMRINYDIKGILLGVQQLLSNYNPESPYEKLINFDFKAQPERYANKNRVWKFTGDYIRIPEDDTDSDNYIDTYEDDDGTVYKVFKTFIKVIEGTDIVVDEYKYLEYSSSNFNRISTYSYEWCDEEGII